MTTPGQEAKQYAEQHGFKIQTIGRRYKVTHVATGTTFERGGYPAVLNEMRVIQGCEENGTRAAAIERESGCDVQQIGRALRRSVAEIRRSIPWNVYVDGQHMYSAANYAGAVKYVRRLMSDGAFRKQRITIDYVPF